MAGADAVVMAAGAGAGSGPARKRTVDLGGALKLIEAAQANGVPRYVMLSAMGAGDPDAAPGPMAVQTVSIERQERGRTVRSAAPPGRMPSRRT